MGFNAWVVVVLAFFLGGWLVFDGAHALITGDYVTPKSGRYAGQLGPWAQLVAAIGIDPRSTAMRCVHVVLGSAWLVVATCYLSGLAWAWSGMLVLACLSLWYLPFGTGFGALQIVLLLSPPLRNGGGA